MNIKDKIIFGLIIILLVGGGYIQNSYTQVMKKMDVLASQDLYSKATPEEPIINTHVDEVNQEFREDLRKLNLEFIGRGKHVRQAQLDILANTELIARNTDSLSLRINDVLYELNEFKEKMDRELADLSWDQRDMQESFSTYRSRVTTQISNLEQSIAAIKNDVDKLNQKVFEKEQAKSR